MGHQPRVLQICHDYNGPFRLLAKHYAGAFADCDVTTVFLRGAESAEVSRTLYGDVVYLMQPSEALRGLKREVADMVAELIDPEEPPDLVIAHRYKPFNIAMQLNSRFEFGAVIGVMHEFGFLGRMTRSLYSRFWKDNVYLVGVSEPVSEEVRTHQKHLAGRVYTVPNAIEAPVLLDSVTARYELGIPLGVHCYGTIGRLVRKKNHKLMLSAFAQCDDDAVLAIVGEGELLTQLSQQARQLGISDRIVFCGSRPDARRYMKAFDTFLLSSTQEEAFGMVLLEAMASMIPVITSDAAGPLSVVGDTALTFPCDDVNAFAEQMKAARAMTRQETAAMTERALQRLGKEFSIAVMLERLRRLPPVEKHAPISY